MSEHAPSQGKAAELQARMKDLDSHIEALNESILQLNKEADQKITALNTYNAESQKNGLDQNNDEVKRRNEEVRLEIAKLEKEITEKTEEVSSLSDERNKIESELNGTHNDTSPRRARKVKSPEDYKLEFDSILAKASTVQELAEEVGKWNRKSKTYDLGKDLGHVHTIINSSSEEERRENFDLIQNQELKAKVKELMLRESIDAIKQATDINEVLSALKTLDAQMELEPASVDKVSHKVSDVIQRITWALEAHKKMQSAPSLVDEEKNSRDHWIDLLPEVYAIKETVKSIFDAMPIPSPAVEQRYTSEVLDKPYVNKVFKDQYENLAHARDEMYITLRQISIKKEITATKKRISTKNKSMNRLIEKSSILDTEAIKDWKPEDLEQYKQDIRIKRQELQDKYNELQKELDIEEDNEGDDMQKGDELLRQMTYLNDDIAVATKLETELEKIHIEPRFESGLYKGMTAAEKDAAVKNFEIEKKQLEDALKKIPAHDERHQLLLNRIKDLDKSIAGDTDVAGQGTPVQEVNLSDEKAFWAEEKKKAQVELDAARDRYIRQMKADRDAEQSAGFFTKVLRAPGRLFEELGVKKPHLSPEYIRLRDGYDTAKKRYGNALSNEFMEDMKDKQGGNIPSHITETKKKWGLFGEKVTLTKENNLFNSINEQVSLMQLKEVAIKEAKALKDAEIEGLPPREKTAVKKILEGFARQPLWVRAAISSVIATGAVATFTGVSLATAPAAVMLGTRYLHGVVLAPIAAALGMQVRKASESLAQHTKGSRVKKLEKQFSVIADVNDLEKLEQAFERQMFRSKVYGWMTTGSFAAITGLQVRQAMAESGIAVSAAPSTEENSENIELEKPAAVSIDDGTAEKVYAEDYRRLSEQPKVPDASQVDQGAPYDTSSLGRQMTAPGEVSYESSDFDMNSSELDSQIDKLKARLDEHSAVTLEQSSGEEGLKFNTETQHIPQENPPQVAEIGPGKVAKTFTDDIHDVENGKRLVRGDSAELSAKRIFEKNAKALGHTFDSKMSVKKWAEVQVEKLVKDHPEVRNAITHNNNKISIDFDEKGNVVNVRIGQGEGRMPTLDGKAIAQSDISKPIEEPVVKKGRLVSDSANNNAPRPKVVRMPVSVDDAPKAKVVSPSPSTEQMATQVSKELPVRVADIFEQKKGLLGGNNALNDPRWIAASTIKADALLKTKLDNIPQFLRSQGVVVDGKLQINRSEIIGLKNMVEAGKDYGVLKKGMTVGDVFRKVVEAETKLKNN